MSTPQYSKTHKTPLFGKQQSTYIKGVAIIMLILHHLFLFPTGNPWFTSLWGNRWGGFEFSLSAVGKLCIPLFFFVSGYGIQLASKADTHLWKSTFKRIRSIYAKYAVAILTTVLLFYLQSGSLVLKSASQTFDTFLGTDVDINGSWWFFIIYVELLLLTPLIVLLVHRFSWKILFALSCFLYFLSPDTGFTLISDIVEKIGLASLFYEDFPINMFWYNQLYFCIGFCLAASGYFEKILHKSMIKLQHPWLRTTIALTLIVLILFFRYYLTDIGALLGIYSKKGIDIYQYIAVSTRADFILSPLFIFALVLLFHQRQLPLLLFFGRQSALIWLIHGVIISLLRNSLQDCHPWSPLVFAAVLVLSSLYAILYTTVAKAIIAHRSQR